MAAIPAVLALAAVAMCCGPENTALDGGGSDSGADARVDSGTDAGARDAGHPVDAARDAGRDGGRGRPVWVPLPGLPDGCEISMAEDPEALGPLTFEACPDLDGCRQIVVDWDSRQAPRFQLAGGYARFTDDEAYFGFARGDDVGFHQWIVAGATGRLHAVLRSPAPVASDDLECFISRMAVGQRRAAVSVQVLLGTSVGPSGIGLLEWSDPSASATYRTLANLPSSLLGPTNAPQEIEIGDDFVAAHIVLRNDVLRVGFDGSTRWVTSGGGTEIRSAAGEAVFYVASPSGPSVMVADADDVEGRPLWTPGDAQIGGIAADGVDLVWVQMFEQAGPYQYGRVELWGSPYALDTADLRPHSIATVASMFLPRVYAAGGHAATIEERARMSVYSLERGRIGVLMAPSGTNWTGTAVAYLSASEIAVAPQLLATPVPEATTLRIIRYDSVPPE